MLSDREQQLLDILCANKEGVQLTKLATLLGTKNARGVARIRSGIKTNFGGDDVIESIMRKDGTVAGYRLKSDRRPIICGISD